MFSLWRRLRDIRAAHALRTCNLLLLRFSSKELLSAHLAPFLGDGRIRRHELEARVGRIIVELLLGLRALDAGRAARRSSRRLQIDHHRQRSFGTGDRTLVVAHLVNLVD